MVQITTGLLTQLYWYSNCTAAGLTVWVKLQVLSKSLYLYRQHPMLSRSTINNQQQCVEFHSGPLLNSDGDQKGLLSFMYKLYVAGLYGCVASTASYFWRNSRKCNKREQSWIIQVSGSVPRWTRSIGATRLDLKSSKHQRRNSGLQTRPQSASKRFITSLSLTAALTLLSECLAADALPFIGCVLIAG